MTDIQAAVGLKQLEKFEEISNKKLNHYKLYKEYLNMVEEVEIIAPPKEVDSFIPFRVLLRVTKEYSKNNLAKWMDERGIETRTFFKPLHSQPCFEKIIKKQKNKFWRKYSKYYNSIDSHNRGLCLPSFASLSKKQIKYVCNTIKEFYTDPFLQTR